MKLYQVNGKNFCAGFVCEDGVVVRFAPILKKWISRKEEETVKRLRKSGLKVELTHEDGECK